MDAYILASSFYNLPKIELIKLLKRLCINIIASITEDNTFQFDEDIKILLPKSIGVHATIYDSSLYAIAIAYLHSIGEITNLGIWEYTHGIINRGLIAYIHENSNLKTIYLRDLILFAHGDEWLDQYLETRIIFEINDPEVKKLDEWLTNEFPLIISKSNKAGIICKNRLKLSVLNKFTNNIFHTPEIFINENYVQKLDLDIHLHDFEKYDNEFILFCIYLAQQNLKI